MQGGWARLQRLLLLVVVLVQAEAAPGGRGTPRGTPRGPRRLSPALLPRPQPALPPSLAVPLAVWVDATTIIFPHVAAVQWYWVRGQSEHRPPGPGRQAAEAFQDQCMTAAMALSVHVGLPYLLWVVVDGRLPAAAREYSYRHREDNQGRYFLVIGSYEESDGDGAKSIAELQGLNLWFSRARYVLVLDTSSLPAGRRCLDSVAAAVSAALWRSSSATVGVILGMCPWRIVLHSPYEADAVVVHAGNVSALADIMDASRGGNFHDQTWSISIYPSYPTLVREAGPGQAVTHTGVDGWVMATAADYFNFTPDIEYPADQDARGYSENGTGTGTLGPVMTGKAIISFNSRFVKDYNTEDIEFSYPYVMDELCVMVPPADRIPNYITIFRCFSPQVWFALAAAFVCASAATRGLDLVHAPRRPPGFGRPDLANAVFSVYAMLLSGAVGSPHARARETSSILLFCSGLFFSVTFMGAFQGLLFKSLTKAQYYPEVDTLVDLADSGITITTRSHSLADTFSFPTKLMHRLQANFKVVPKNHSDSLSAGFLIRRNGAFLTDDNKGLHLVNECPRKYMLAYITNRNFPFLDAFDAFLLRCMDSGLMSRWLRLTYEAAPDSRVDDDLELSLFEVEAAFFALAIGVLASVLAFALELLYHRCCRRRGRVQAHPGRGRPRPLRRTRARRKRPQQQQHCALQHCVDYRLDTNSVGVRRDCQGRAAGSWAESSAEYQERWTRSMMEKRQRLLFHPK